MTNGIAVFVVLVIVGLAAYDGLARDAEGLVFLMRKFVDLTEYLAFWR